jgi:hypothetical protein
MEEVGSQSLTALDRQPLNHEKTRWLLPLRVSDGRVVCVIEDEGVAGWMDLQSKGIMGMWTWQHNPNRPLWDVGDELAGETLATWDLAHYGNDTAVLMSALTTLVKRLSE